MNNWSIRSYFWSLPKIRKFILCVWVCCRKSNKNLRIWFHQIFLFHLYHGIFIINALKSKLSNFPNKVRISKQFLWGNCIYECNSWAGEILAAHKYLLKCNWVFLTLWQCAPASYQLSLAPTEVTFLVLLINGILLPLWHLGQRGWGDSGQSRRSLQARKGEKQEHLASAVQLCQPGPFLTALAGGTSSFRS